MKIHFSKLISNTLTNCCLGIISFNCEVKQPSEDLWQKINDYSQQIRQNTSLDQVNKIETIAAARNAYKKCGKDPNRYRPSADSLLRRIVKGNSLYMVNNVVDVLNYISIQSGYSIGGYDISRIDGEVLLDIGTSSDNYSGIGRGELNIEGLPVLRDNIGVFGTPTSDSERTSITIDTKQCMFVFFDFGNSQTLIPTLKATEELLITYAWGKNFNTEFQIIQNIS